MYQYISLLVVLVFQFFFVVTEENMKKWAIISGVFQFFFVVTSQIHRARGRPRTSTTFNSFLLLLLYTGAGPHTQKAVFQFFFVVTIRKAKSERDYLNNFQFFFVVTLGFVPIRYIMDFTRFQFFFVVTFLYTSSYGHAAVLFQFFFVVTHIVVNPIEVPVKQMLSILFCCYHAGGIVEEAPCRSFQFFFVVTMQTPAQPL